MRLQLFLLKNMFLLVRLHIFVVFNAATDSKRILCCFRAVVLLLLASCVLLVFLAVLLLVFLFFLLSPLFFELFLQLKVASKKYLEHLHPTICVDDTLHLSLPLDAWVWDCAAKHAQGPSQGASQTHPRLRGH